ncbi:hypothetical protein MalM25_31010 [Planctomycetes bacterium MalM25]|nr:hypothetical protein MalM25_31010 [Planctomycetes bacterium MalM25]
MIGESSLRSCLLASNMPKLRRIELRSLDEVIREITDLRDNKYAQGGEWNLSQVCEHLTETVRIELDGAMKPLPWVLRATVGNFVFWLFASRIVHGLSGIPTLPQLVPKPLDADDSGSIERCLDTLHEARDCPALTHTYPLATSVTVDRWREMMTVHAQHHLEFLKPLGGSS